MIKEGGMNAVGKRAKLVSWIKEQLPLERKPRFSTKRDQTDTPAFKAWFGDSKVVDEQGNPLVVYHGTIHSFDAFSPFHSNRGAGMWFTDDPSRAGDYANAGGIGTFTPQIYPVYLSLKNPKITDQAVEIIQIDAADLVSDGHDGVIGTMPNGDRYYIALQPTQIKSATGNVGTFDAANPDIRFSSKPTYEARRAAPPGAPTMSIPDVQREQAKLRETKPISQDEADARELWEKSTPEQREEIFLKDAEASNAKDRVRQRMLVDAQKKVMETESREDAERFLSGSDNLMDARGETGRTLRGYRSEETPETRIRRGIMEALSSMPKEMRKRMKKAKDEGRLDDLMEMRVDHFLAKLQSLREAGLDPATLDISDPNSLAAAMRKMREFDASWDDMLYEYWINSILSGPGTHVANLTGALHGIYDQFVVESISATVRGEPGQQAAVLKGASRGFSRAWSNALMSFTTERNQLEMDLTGKSHGTLDLQRYPGAIKNKAGRIIRTPTRTIVAMDAFLQTIFYQAALAESAYNKGRAAEKEGAALSAFIEQYMEEHSQGRQKPDKWALERSRDYMFKSRDKLLQAPMLGGLVKTVETAKEQDNMFGLLSKFMFPFTTTPGNLARIGIGSYTPLGSFGIGMKYVRTKQGKTEWVYDSKGDGTLTGEGKRQMIHDMVQQFIVSATAFGLMALIAGDEEGEPRITGANATWLQRGEKGHEMRNYPPMSIRIGADQWYSYKRLDPFATGLAMLVDYGWALKRSKNGMEYEDNRKKFIKAITGQLKEKTYLRPIGDIMKAIEAPESFGQSLAVNYGSSFMPAVIRTGLVAGDDTVRSFVKTDDSTLLGRIAERSGLGEPLPKRGPWGRPIEKPQFGMGITEWGSRLFSPARQVDTSTATNLDRLITNWNMQNPNDQYYVSIPRTEFTYRKEKYRMGDEGYDEFQRVSGAYILKWWERQEQLGRIDYTQPTKRHRDLLMRVVDKSRKRARLTVLKKGLARKL
jgi:hypothetical protein